ncbi:MAG: glycoside hydrolase family 44 protein [Terracidiphilus sp.]
MRMAGRYTGIWLGLALSLWISACGGSISSPPPQQKTTPQVTVTPSSQSITTAQPLTVTVMVAGSPTPTGSVTLSSGSYSSGTATLTNGSASFNISAGALATGTDTLTANYTPDAAGSSTYNSASGTASVTVTSPVLIAPAVTVTPGSMSITTDQPLTVTVAVSGGSGNPIPTGSVTLSSGGYTSAAAALVNGSASFNVPAGSLATGTITLTATYTPDAGSSSTYTSAMGTGSVTVTVPLITPTVTVSPSSMSITSAQALTVTVAVSGGNGNPIPTGSVRLASGTYASAATALVNGSASINIPAGSLTAGTDTLTATYTPDTGSSSTYLSAMGTGSVTITNAATYVLSVDSAGPSSGISIGVSPADNNGAGTGTTPFTRTYNAGAEVTLSAPELDNGNSFVSWTGCTPVSGTPTNCTVTLNAATTVTATYNGIEVISIALACTTVSTQASCSNTATTGTVAIGTQAQFTATVNGTGSYSKSVTWSMSCPACGSLSPGDFASTTTTTALYNTPYPAPATVVITAASASTPSITGSMTVTLSAPAATGPALSVDVNTPNTPSENPHAISPYVYGMNAYVLDPASEKIANPGVLRWGGDDTSRYNYQNNMTNSASDYYFENFLGGGGQYPNATGSTNFTQFVQSADNAGSAALGTVPVLGWVSNSTQYACGFPESQFPDQQSYSPSNCGNGEDSDGTELFGNSTTQANTSIAEPAPDITAASTPAPGASNLASWADGTWPGGWVNSLATNSSYGNGASGKGAALWDLDNEPTWWDSVHRDVHPVPFTYDEVTNGGIGTALAIKTADPTALVSGPVIDNWWAYFYSKKDIESGWDSGPCYQPWSDPTDRAAHGGTALIEYYLQQFQKYSQSYGVRLLDYVDIHGYFAPDYNGNSVAFTTAGDTQAQQTRMNGTRVFWDPSYTDPNYPQPNYSGAPATSTNCSPPLQAPDLIPMMQGWVANDYPGTKTGIDEYNFGGLESINGALVEADILGIFGRQGLDLGAFWPTTNYSQQGPGNYAFAMYRNYDLKNDGAVFGDAYLYATSTGAGGDGEGLLAVYGAQRSSDGAVTVMVINKTYGPLTSTLSLKNFTTASASAQVYLYSNANLSAIVPQAAATVTPPSGSGTTSTITYTFPAQSITLLVAPD